MNLTKEKLESLKAIASSATPGPWHVDRPFLNFGYMTVSGVIPKANLHPEEQYQVETEHSHGTKSFAKHIAVPAHAHDADDRSDAARNMEHIAGFNPQTALALIAEIERLRGASEAMLTKGDMKKYAETRQIVLKSIE